jgi:cytochrome P450
MLDERKRVTPRLPDRYKQLDLNDLRLGAAKVLWGRVLDRPRWILWLLRQFWPIASIFSWVIVTRFDDVQEVLSHDQIFEVPYSEKVKELDGGPNFLLGMEDGDEYRDCKRFVMQAFRLEDVSTIVAQKTVRISRELLDNCGGRIDAIEGFITRVSTEICREYFGLPIANAVDFGHWTIALSTHVFVDATTNVPRHRHAAMIASENIRQLVDYAIAKTKEKPGGSSTIVERLIGIQNDGAQLSDEAIRAILIGMVTGFVPTTTLAAGRILEMLLNQPDFMAEARAAVRAGDDDRLRRCLFEVLRFRHIHWGLSRICTRGYKIAGGTWRSRTIRPRKKVLASTWAAMFDGRRVNNPSKFDPDRAPTDYMLFGYGLHWCVGAYIAQAQITHGFKTLLEKEKLRAVDGRDGKLQLLGYFPQHLFVEFETCDDGSTSLNLRSV